jgi:DNA-binding transcriptional ArsR family regulator
MNAEKMSENAESVELLLKAMANRQRLMILCQLLDGEVSVTTIVEAVGLSQSAISQHLSVLRNKGLVKTRRESQTIYYSIANQKVLKLMDLLYELFCKPETDLVPLMMKRKKS